MSKAYREIDEYYQDQRENNNVHEKAFVLEYEYTHAISRASESSRRLLDMPMMRLEAELDVELNGPLEFEAQRTCREFLNRLQVYSSPEVERSIEAFSKELTVYIQNRVKNNT